VGMHQGTLPRPGRIGPIGRMFSPAHGESLGAPSPGWAGRQRMPRHLLRCWTPERPGSPFPRKKRGNDVAGP